MPAEKANSNLNGKEKLLNEKLEEVFSHIEESAQGSASENNLQVI